jgi:hypothetical protein
VITRERLEQLDNFLVQELRSKRNRNFSYGVEALKDIRSLIASSAPEPKRPSVTMDEVEAFLKRGMGAIDYVIVFPEDLANFLRSLGAEVEKPCAKS